jgi:hypothetical protein
MMLAEKAEFSADHAALIRRSLLIGKTGRQIARNRCFNRSEQGNIAKEQVIGRGQELAENGQSGCSAQFDQ